MPDKYQREIEEILRRMGEQPPGSEAGEDLRARWLRVRLRFAQFRAWFASVASPGNLIRFSLMLLLASLLLRFIMPRFALYTTSIALVLLVVGVAGFALAEHNPTTRGWRGRTFSMPGDALPRWRLWWVRWLDYWGKR